MHTCTPRVRVCMTHMEHETHRLEAGLDPCVAQAVSDHLNGRPTVQLPTLKQTPVKSQHIVIHCGGNKRDNAPLPQVSSTV